MKTVIEMARESTLLDSRDDWGSVPIEYEVAINAFAELVRADEREACAKLAEPDEEHRRDASWGYIGGTEGVELLDGVAAAIRARSNT